MSSNYTLLVAFHVWPHKAYLAQGDKWISVVQQYITALIVYPLENLKNNSSELFSSFCILTICFINQGTWWHKLFECFKDWAILWYLFGSLFYRVQCHYNVLNFLQKSHNEGMRARYGVYFVSSKSASSSVPFTAVLYAIQCYGRYCDMP